MPNVILRREATVGETIEWLEENLDMVSAGFLKQRKQDMMIATSGVEMNLSLGLLREEHHHNPESSARKTHWIFALLISLPLPRYHLSQKEKRSSPFPTLFSPVNQHPLLPND